MEQNYVPEENKWNVIFLQNPKEGGLFKQWRIFEIKPGREQDLWKYFFFVCLFPVYNQYLLDIKDDMVTILELMFLLFLGMTTWLLKKIIVTTGKHVRQDMKKH